jgi:hypothetical protein
MSFCQFKDGKLTFRSKARSLRFDGGPPHMVTNEEGTVTETSCVIQPVKTDEAGILTFNGDPVAITQSS